jgi:hypothetical protein
MIKRKFTRGYFIISGRPGGREDASGTRRAARFPAALFSKTGGGFWHRCGIREYCGAAR